MIKAIYLTIVFFLPALFYPLGLEHFQDLWIWYYIPFALVYGIYVWLKPTDIITKYIVLTPVYFLLFLILAISVPMALEQGVSEALNFIPVMLIFAVPAGLVFGAIYILLAVLILNAFIKLGYEFKNS